MGCCASLEVGSFHLKDGIQEDVLMPYVWYWTTPTQRNTAHFLLGALITHILEFCCITVASAKKVGHDHSPCKTSFLTTKTLWQVVFRWLGNNTALSEKTAQMLLNKLLSLCIVLTSWNIYANLALTKGKRIIIGYEENNVTTFVFTSMFYGGILTLRGFCLGRHRGIIDFHLFCFQFCYHSFQLISHFIMLIVGVWFWVSLLSAGQ